MELVNVKCDYCGKGILLREDSVRKINFCTLGCLSSYMEILPKEKIDIISYKMD